MPPRRTNTTAALTDFDHCLAAAKAAVPLSGQTAADSDIAQVSFTLGAEVGAFGKAAATALTLGGDLYAGLPGKAADVQKKAERLKRLEVARDAVIEWLGDIKRDIAFTRVDLGRDVTLVLQTTDAVLLNPTTPALARRRALGASQDLRALRDGRSGRRRAAVQRTRTLKTGFAGTQAEASGENAALKAELAQARLEIQYLAGEQLRPSDLGAPPPSPATAPAARRRRPR